MAAIVPFIPYIVAAGGTLMQGAAAKNAANAEAGQLESIAGQSRAASQREMANQRRSSRYAQSRAIALAAASGAGAGDPSVVDLVGDIEGEGEYGALSAMFEGEDRATGLEYGATLSRRQGQAAMTGSAISAGSTLLSGGSSWYGKYGGTGAPGAGSAFAGVAPGVTQGTARSDYQNNRGINSARYA